MFQAVVNAFPTGAYLLVTLALLGSFYPHFIDEEISKDNLKAHRH